MNKNDLEILKNNLPEIPGIQGKLRYFNSAVLVPLLYWEGEYHLLFQKRTSWIRQGDEVCFPGGKYEPENDSSFKDTAIRETIEELGITKDKIKILGNLDTLFSLMGATVDAFPAVLDVKNLDELVLDKNEVAKVFTIPVKFFMENPPQEYNVIMEAKSSFVDEEGNHVNLLPVEELGLPDRYSTPWGQRTRRVLVYQSPEEVVWGVTAEIVHELVEKINGESNEL